MPEYEPLYYEYASRGENWTSFPRREVVKFVKNRYPHRVSILDVGCGTAEILSHVSQAAYYRGVERSEYAIREAEKRWFADPRDIKFLKAEMPLLPFRDKEFDIVFFLFSLEHVHDPKGFLRESLRLLKTGGFLIILAPNLEFPLAWPAALRHSSRASRVCFYFIRLWDYAVRFFGVYSFRIVRKNFTDATGKYERKDDDLRVLVSSWETIRFLEKNGAILEEFWEESNHSALRRALRYAPTLRWYGMPLAAAFRKV